MASNDWALLEQWRREGNSEAFGELVARYAGMVHRTCCRILGNTSDAQDLTQECFAQLAQHPEQPRTHLGAWLHRVATTRSLNRLDSDRRRHQREKEYVESMGDSVPPAFSRELQETVDTAIAELPEELHAAVVEHFLNGRTHEAIAEDTGVSRQTITYRTQKGIELIRKSLQRRGVLVPVSVLFAALSSGISEAVPVPLAANLGRLALAGPRALQNGTAAVQSVHWLSRITSVSSWPTLAGTGAAFLLVVTLFVAVPYYWNPASDMQADTKPSEAASPGEKNISAVSPPAASQSSAGLAEKAPDSTTKAPKGCTFDLKVYDENGTIPNASVLIERRSWERWQVPPENSERWTGESDPGGLAHFVGMQPGHYLVTVTAATQAGVSWIVAEEAGRTYSAGVCISPAGAVEGVIVDEQGKPVPGAYIGPYQWSEDILYIWYDYALALRAKSDENGRFRIDRLRRGSWKFFVRAPGYAMRVTDVLPTDGPPVTITIAKGGEVHCRVLEASTGTPLAGVTVMLFGPAVWDSFPVQTDQNGEIRVPNLAVGKHKVCIFDQTYFQEGDSQIVTITGTSEPVDITIKAVVGGQVEGRVYDAETGRGIAEATVVQEDKLPMEGVSRRLAVTDADGRYRIGGGILDGSGILRVLEAPGYQASASDSPVPVVHRADARIFGMDFALERGRSISGVVLTASGQPAPNLSVTIVGDAKGARQETPSEADGSFSVEGFGRGSLVYACASGNGVTSDMLGPFSVPEEGIKGLKLLAQPESTLSGIVVSLDGTPLPSWQVLATRIDKRSMERDPLLTDAKGHFLLTGLCAGTYAIAAAPPRARFGDEHESERVVLTAGQRLTGLQIVCDTSLSISGHVQGDRGREGMLVECFGPVNASAYTDEYGDFVITGLAEGSYDMRASGQGCCSAELKDIPAGTSDVFFQMRAMAFVTGCVVRSDMREPVTSYEIAHFPGAARRLPDGEPLVFRQVQDPQGMFWIDRLERGDNTIVIRASGFPVTFFHLTDVPASGAISGITVSLEPGRTVSGIVLDSHRAPISGASLFLDTLPGRESRLTNRLGSSDTEGRFQIDCIPFESAIVVCYKDGYAPVQREVPAGHGAATPISLTLDPALQLEGVVTLGGEPVSGQEVRVRPLHEPGGPEQHTETDRDGTFGFDSLGPGEVTIEATLRESWLDPPQIRRLSTNIALNSAASDTFVLDLPQGEGLVVGTVTDKGEPVSGLTIRAEFPVQNGIETIETQSLQDGSFLMEFAPAGGSTITVIDEASNGHSHEQRVVIKSGEPTLLEIALDQEPPIPSE